MSTKVTEQCPVCDAAVSPTDKVIVYPGNVPCKTWRYECMCGWVFANALQREHNGREYAKMYKAVSRPEYCS